MKSIKNMRELELLKKNIKYQQMLHEKELTTSSVKILNNFGDRLKDFAFELGAKMVLSMFKKGKGE